MAELTEANVDDRAEIVFKELEKKGMLKKKIYLMLLVNKKYDKAVEYYDKPGTSTERMNRVMTLFKSYPAEKKIEIVKELEDETSRALQQIHDDPGRPRSASAPSGGRRKSRRRGRKSKKMRRRRTLRK